MKHHDTNQKRGLITGLIVIGLIACLPIVAASVFMLRFVLVALVAVIIIGAPALYAFSPTFRQRLKTLLEPETVYMGLRQPTNVALSPAHVWARVEPKNAFVGVDDLAQSTLGPLTGVELPAIGAHVTRGEPLFTLRRGQRRLEMPSPIDGTVLGGNDALLADPEAVNREPFKGGWVVRIEPDSPWRARRGLLRGLEARAWFQGEVDRLLASINGSSKAWSLPDGGVLVNDLYQLIDEAAWERLRKSFFESDDEADTATDRKVSKLDRSIR